MQFGDGLTDLAVTFAVGDFDFRFHIAKAIGLNRHDEMLENFAFCPEALFLARIDADALEKF